MSKYSREHKELATGRSAQTLSFRLQSGASGEYILAPFEVVEEPAAENDVEEVGPSGYTTDLVVFVSTELSTKVAEVEIFA